MSKLITLKSLSIQRLTTGRAGFRKIQKQFGVISCLLMLTAILCVNIPAQNAHQSPQNNQNTIISQPVFASSILDFFNFLDFGSLFGSQTNGRTSRSVSPAVEDYDGATPRLPDPPTVAAAPCSSVGGATINVPGTFPTIQAAINAANPSGGDTIQVAAGTYTEQLIINKCVFINGAGQGSTIIQSPPALANSSVIGITNTSSIVEIRSAAYVTMSNLTVTGPVPFDKDVYGIFVVENATLDMDNSRVTAIHKNSGIDGVQRGNAVRVRKRFF